MNVDNLRLDGNTISSTDTNGNVTIDPAGTGQISLSAPVEVQSTGGATPTYSHTNNGEGLTFRYNDDSGARAADIVATGNTPAGATMAMRFFTNPNSTDAAAEVMRLQNGTVGINNSISNSFYAGGNNLVVGSGSGSEGITIYGGAESNLFFGDGTDIADNLVGRIEYSHGSNNMSFYTNNSFAMRIDSGGKVRIGNSNGVYTEKFLVQSDTSSVNPMTVNNTRSSASTDYAIIFGRNGSIVGSIQTSLSATSYLTSSDYRLKTNVSYDWDATSRLKQLKPARFKWISDGDNGVPVDGFIAHQVETIVPEAISGTKDAMRDEEYEITPAVLDDDGNEVTPAKMGTRSVPDYQSIDQAKIVPLLTKALIESVEKIEQLEARITALEAE